MGHHHWMYAMDKHGETPATRARKSGYTVLAEMLLSQERAELARHPSPPMPTASNDEAYWGMGRAVQTLMKDSQPVRKDPVGLEQQLHDATRNGDLDRAAALLEKGVVDVDRVSDQGLTALHWSALNGRTDMAELLLEHGAQINARETYTGKLTPMAMALLMGYDEMVELMASRGGVC